MEQQTRSKHLESHKFPITPYVYNSEVGSMQAAVFWCNLDMMQSNNQFISRHFYQSPTDTRHRLPLMPSNWTQIQNWNNHWCIQINLRLSILKNTGSNLIFISGALMFSNKAQDVLKYPEQCAVLTWAHLNHLIRPL